ADPDGDLRPSVRALHRDGCACSQLRAHRPVGLHLESFGRAGAIRAEIFPGSAGRESDAARLASPAARPTAISTVDTGALLALLSRPKRGDLRAVPAQGHAAPTATMGFRAV